MTCNCNAVRASAVSGVRWTTIWFGCFSVRAGAQEKQDTDHHPLNEVLSPNVWRSEKRIVDLHQHIENNPERLARAVKILDGAGVGTGVLLGAGAVTKRGEQPSDFEAAKTLADRGSGSQDSRDWYRCRFFAGGKIGRLGLEPDAIERYTEFEWAPNGEFLDLKVDLPA